ncbi:hypothetical protein L873DRAFT_1831220 [Choiromyces venosus 120613-1]|uniref:Histone deacetylase complex subunit SAP30 Sin3 binding domain-containing protein n=1 Tax=Choiromyces venosus 120613-1 TaxID=1336337 RepID=A0A3N4J6Q0_9PEZI|nr:hypothetical protein L873DRAFT_1831220 [Choiromyces venosus 120613-1]
MPPARPRPNPHDDSRSETSVGKPDREKSIDKRRQQNAAPPNSQEKSLNGGASVCGVVGAGASTNANGTHAHEGIEGMGWSDIDIRTLHRYRYAYRLSTPSSSGGFNNTVLSTGIGRRSPARARARIGREALATAVRKNFNAQPIQENDVIVNFLYSVKNQDKRFRLRFPPPISKKHET